MTKAQQAAVAESKKLAIHRDLPSVVELVSEYKLENLKEALEEIYEVFMKAGHYAEAAAFAKKYGL